MFNTSGCSSCDESECFECTEKACCGGLMKRYWNSTTNQCVDPAEVFGAGCLESDGDTCTLCTAQTCCEDNEYFDESRVKCVRCSSVLKCVTCSNGYSCDSCNETEFYKLVDGKCVVDCDRKFSINGCSTCSEKKCLECSEKSCCGDVLNRYWNATTSKCVDPSILGEGCLKSDGDKCTLCTAQSCCANDEYYDILEVRCKPCSVFGETCSQCTKGGCVYCGSNQGITVNASGHCVECASQYGNGCLKCDRTRCTEAKDGYVVIGVKPMECTELFGDCNKCDVEGCTECESNLVEINGYCRSCSILYGENCTACSKNGCEECVEQPGISLVNGACVDCEQAYGNGCSRCSSETGCEEHMEGYFLSKRFSLPCSIFLELPGDYQGFYEECMNGSPNSARRWAAARGEKEEEDQSTIVLDFNERSITIQCSNLTAMCSRCKDDDGQAKCTKCNDGYLLVGWTCSPCSEQFPDGSCSACNSAGCTSCIEEGMNVANNGKCIKCRDGEQVFDTTSNTCVDCGTLFSRCSTCNKDKCLSCEGESFIYDEETGACQTCSELYGSGCTECNNTHCIKCTDDDCCEKGQQIVVMDGTATCGSCSMLDENCAECTTEDCTNCKDDSMFIEDGKCVKCSDRFDECDKCTADMCLGCTNPDSKKMILTYDGCYPNDTMEDGDNSSSSSSSSFQPITVPSSLVSGGDGGSKAGMIAGIVVGCLVVAAIVGIAVYCVATNGAKHGKISADIFEEDDNYVSMSVL